MTQRFRKIDVSESINSNDIVSTSINSLYNTTGIQKCKDIYCDSLNTTNIECTNISIGGTVLGTSIGGGSGIKTSYNINNSIPVYILNSIDYDIYTSIRTTNLSIIIEPIINNITNNNQLKKFYIYIENSNDITTNTSITLQLLVNVNSYSNIFYEEWILGKSDIIKKLTQFSNTPTYEIQPSKYIILEIIPFIYPEYNVRLVIKNYNNNNNNNNNNKTSYNIGNEITNFTINSIDYDIYTSSRISNISMSFNIQNNEINLLKTFYIQIENSSNINPISITFYREGSGIRVYHKSSTDDTYLKKDLETYTLPQYRSIYLFEITPISYPSSNIDGQSGAETFNNTLNLYIKSYKYTGTDEGPGIGGGGGSGR